MDNGRRARRRRRSLVRRGGLAGVALLVAGAAFATGSDHDGKAVTIAADLQATSADGRVTVDLPPGWDQLPLVERSAPSEVLVVGTATRPAGEPIDPCGGLDTVPTARSAFVTLYEYREADLAMSSYFGPLTPDAFHARPLDFRTADMSPTGDCFASVAEPVLPDRTAGSEATPDTDPPTEPPPAPEASVPVDPTTSTSEPTPVPPVPTNHLRQITFQDGGRLFLARLVSVDDADDALLDEAFLVLNSLHIGDAPGTTTTTESAGPADEATATQRIIDAINAAHGTPSPVPLVISVEGGHPFVDPKDAEAAAAQAQQSDELTRRSYAASQEGKLVARINWIVFDSPTHARLNFDLLADGQLMTATTTGYAVFEDGNWRLGRATFCEMVSRGGLQCPS